MSGEDITSIIIGIIIIITAIKVLDEVIRWIYITLNWVGRVIMAVITALTIQFITKSIFGIGITDFSWGSIGAALVMAFLFPNSKGGDSA
ncbi:MAG: hypothetical protein AAF969_15670 [Bacteroidota bacterium]